MPAPLSIIIPTFNVAADLPLCLESLLPGLEAGLIREVILADGGSTDATRAIGGAAGALVISSAPVRSQQLRAGAAAARGDWFLFLPPGTALSRDWPERAGAHIDTRPDMAAAFRLKFRSDAREARSLEARMNRRARATGLPVGAQGLLISRGLYEEVGGHADVPLLEDAVLARAIGKQRLVVLDAEARASAAAYEQEGWHKLARSEAWQFLRFRLGAPPEKLAKGARQFSSAHQPSSANLPE